MLNLLRWRFDPLPADSYYAKPVDMLKWLKALYGRRIVDAEAASIQEDIRKSRGDA
jgi:hypothetical protein